MIACGSAHSIILNEKNQIFVCGYNNYGQLGLGDFKDRHEYTELENNFGQIKNIYCCATYSMILNENNELFGSGRLFEPGNDIIILRGKYKKIVHNFGVIKNIFCGLNHNIILNDENELFVCGDNYYGQLGLGDNDERKNYVKLNHNFGIIKKIVCGECYSVILNMDNELFVCGWNKYGQLGLSDNEDRNIFVKLHHNFGKIKNIYCGGDHNIILTAINKIFVCGHNDYGELGLGDFEMRNTHVELKHNFGIIKNIFCGYFHNIILNMDNELFVCGDNEYGQLGLGDNKKRNTFVKLEHNFGKIKNIVCGSRHSIILNEKNEIFVCGFNRFGQLGSSEQLKLFEQRSYDGSSYINTYVKLNQNILEYILDILNNTIILDTNMMIEL
jgi:alpha-tubulin suppressor-like RCC1 family protein